MTRPIIIAEGGINHLCDIELAKEMIWRSQNAGADIFKVQLYNPKELLDPDIFSDEDWEAILQSELTYEQAKELRDYCDELDIEFMASAFDHERLGWLEALGVKRHKIASRSIFDLRYLNAVRSCRKPVIISLGWGKERHVDDRLLETYYKKTDVIGYESLTTIRDRLTTTYRELDTSFLYCVSKYPTMLEDLKDMPIDFELSLYHGFSDHTPGMAAALVALSRGASIIEKHVTIDKTLPGPDQEGSIDFFELESICNFRDAVYKMN